MNSLSRKKAWILTITHTAFTGVLFISIVQLICKLAQLLDTEDRKTV
jgi:hypothetical protein